MPKISIIVPVYNVEEYLPRCIDSILAQSFSDFELIFVDDGSTDRSLDICKEYKEKDSRIHIISKNNGGVSSARNKGIESAIGEYITFCDSDDYVDPIWLQIMYDKIVDSGVDCVATNYREVSESGEVLHESSFRSNDSFFSSDKEKIDYIINSVLSPKIGWSIWNRLFKSKLIKDNLIRFCENCENYAEDLGFFIEYLLVSQAVSNVENCVYNYYQRSGSKMNTVRYDMNLNAINQMVKHIKKSFISSVLQKYYPIIVYRIFYCTEYYKIYAVDSLNVKSLSNEIGKIVDTRFFKENNRKCICSKKVLLEYYSKNETAKIRYFLWYLNHGNYKLFVICDVVFHRYIYKKDT